MIKNISTVFVFVIISLCCHSQQQPVHYGNNSQAGKYYQVRGVKMYVEMYGKGKPLLMIHGNGGSIEAFYKNIPYFSKYYRVIAVDSRAQGKTTDNRDSLSFEMMADDFAALLTGLKIDSAYVLGWSDGGITAILMAMRHPGKVIKFAATGANILADSTALIPSLWNDMKEQYQRDKNKVYSSAKEKNDWKLFMLDYLQPKIKWEQLQTIPCPALIIAGDKDLIAPTHTLSIFQNIPRAQLWIMPSCGHATLQDYPTEFNNKVQQFFKQ